MKRTKAAVKRPRWHKSLVVLALVGLAMVGLTGLVSAGQDPGPVTVGSAAPHQGDRGRYDLRLTGGWHEAGRPQGASFPAYLFELQARGHVLDADAGWREADRFSMQVVATTDRPATTDHPTWFDAVYEAWHAPDGDLVATHGGQALAHLGPQETALGIRQDGTREDAVHDHWTYATTQERDCLLRPPMPASVQVGDTWRMDADCTLSALVMRLPAGTPVEVTGQEEVAGRQTLRIEADGVSVDAVWHLAPDLPYPLRAEFTTAGFLGEPRTAHYDLVAFERGDAPPGDLPATQASALPLQVAQRQVHGPDDTGIKHPYPLSQAYEEAIGHETYNDLRAWRIEHPSAYVFKAAHQHRQDSQGSHHSWEVHLSDGQEGFSFQVTATFPDTPSALAPVLGDHDTDVETLPPDEQARHAPDPNDAPSTMPTVASLWARWLHHAPPSFRHDGANQWSFLILQGDGEVQTRIVIGHASSLSFDGDGLLVAATEKEAASLLSLVDGRAVQYEQFERESRSATLLQAPEAPTPRVAGVSSANLPPLAAYWQAPDAGQAAGIGLLALLAAAAYQVWPLLKTLPGLSLFSRIRPDELLQHPTRRVLMDALHGEPGLHFRALAQRVGMEPGQIRHHLRKLVEGGRVVERKAPGYTCYFPAQGTSRHVIEAAPVVRAAGAKDILGAVATRPGQSGKQLAAAAGLSPATANYHLKRLQEAGLIESRRAGRSLAVHLTPQGRDAMVRLGV